jgi:uncharacterized membrane protein YhaH (DUF805 family)
MWDWVFNCFEKYAVFEGRASRPEYWYFYLFNVCAGVIVSALSFFAGDFRWPLIRGAILITLTPTLAVSSRRLHEPAIQPGG